MPWTRDQVKYLLSDGSPLSEKQKTKMKNELHRNPSLGHSTKKGTEDPEEIEKSFVSRYQERTFYAIASGNVLQLGYAYSDYDVVSIDGMIEETHDEVGQYALIISRSYDNVELKVLDKDINTADAQDAAIKLVENNKNNIRSVSVLVGIPWKFATRPVYATVATFSHVAMTAEKKKEKRDEDKRYLEMGKATTETTTKSSPFEFEVAIKKFDFDQGLVYGIVYAPNDVDTHGDFTSPEEIERAAHEFLPRAQLDKNHAEDVSDVEVVESYIAPVDFTLGAHNVKKGSWLIVSRVNNTDLKKEILEDKITGYSLEGTAVKVEQLT